MNEIKTISQAIEHVVDPSSGKPLKDTDAVKHVAIDDEKNAVTLVIGVKKVDETTKQQLTRSLAKIIKIDLGYRGLKIDFQRVVDEDSLLNKARDIKYIGIASGKGGVGKSTVAANLALALTRIGKRVGIIDADVYGSSIPTIFNMEIKLPKANADEKIIPFAHEGIEIISTEFFLKDNKPLMWRGPMLGKMLNHFFEDIAWHQDIEYMIVDLPPGTGDVAMDIQKLIPQSKMLIITTPHPSASHVAIKAGYAAKELNHELLGVVENMSVFHHNGESITIFGEGGGAEVAERLETDLLAQIPIGQPESGHHSLYGMEEPIGIDYLGLANKLIKSL